MVLDISGFARTHPGGAFVLRQNIGRDISKFFYGGYSMENQHFPAEWLHFPTQHFHSNMARKVANSIIVGRLVELANEEVFEISERFEVNSFTQTITLTSDSSTAKARLFYEDLSMVGKHFLVRDVSRPSLKRHYTTANCMKPNVYAEYTRTIGEYLAHGIVKATIDPALLGEKDGNSIVLTLKNYGVRGGLSAALSDPDNSSAYLIKGPMGTGLDV